LASLSFEPNQVIRCTTGSALAARIVEVARVFERGDAAAYVGQVEMDPTGTLWAVLYNGATVITREQVRSLRRGKRRVADLVLSAADSFPAGYRPPVPAHLNRIVTQPTRSRRRHLPAPAI
jgi:hypothetical protein